MKGFQVWKITETKTQKIFAVTVLKKTMRVTTTKKSTKDIAHTKIRMEYSGESKASLHCGFNLCFSDWWRILLHPWVSQQRRIIYAVRKKRKYLCNTQPALLAEIPMAFGHLHQKVTIYRHLKPEKVILIHKVMETKNLDYSKNVFMVEQSHTHFVEQ